MNYVEYLEKKYQDYEFKELASVQVDAERMKRSKDEGLKLLGESYQMAINQILNRKDLVFMKKFAELKRLLYEQKRIY